MTNLAPTILEPDSSVFLSDCRCLWLNQVSMELEKDKTRICPKKIASETFQFLIAAIWLMQSRWLKIKFSAYSPKQY